MMSTLRTSALGALAIAALAASAGASAQVSPGWYASVGAYSSEINDANGTTTPTVISLAPDVITPGQACLLGPATGAIPELGGALEGLGGTLAGDTGCLLGLIGPGADDDIQPGQQVESQGQAQPIGVIFDGGFGINTAIGYQFIGGLRPELTLALSTNDFKVITSSAELADQRNNVGGKLEATRVGANLWFDIPVGERVLPYLGAGLGFQSAKTTFDSTGSDTDTGSFFQAGAGLGYLLNPRTVISLDYRYLVSSDIESSSFIPATMEPDPANGGPVGTRLDDRYEHEAHHIGMSLRYVYSVAKVADADGDGVADFLDRCPNTPAGVQVDRFGCPLDSDGDGIPDHLDKCPNTAPGVQVDDKGCPSTAMATACPITSIIARTRPRARKSTNAAAPWTCAIPMETACLTCSTSARTPLPMRQPMKMAAPSTATVTALPTISTNAPTRRRACRCCPTVVRWKATAAVPAPVRLSTSAVALQIATLSCAASSSSSTRPF